MKLSIVFILSLIHNQLYYLYSFALTSVFQSTKSKYSHTLYHHYVPCYIKYITSSRSALHLSSISTISNSIYTTSHSNNIQMSLADKITNAVKLKFQDSTDSITRVIKCWDNFSKGIKVNRYLDSKEEILQQADCYVDGLGRYNYSLHIHYSYLYHYYIY